MQDIEKLSVLLKQKKYQLSTAESCTGGLIAKLCTDLAGSSLWFERGFVTYSNESKTEMLGVDKIVIEQYGAVSQEVAENMALGALKFSHSDINVSVTGIAGPGGGSEKKPVGTVWIAWALPNTIKSECFIFVGNREQIRAQTASMAIQGLIKLLLSK